MVAALTEALKPLRPDSQRQVILLSDDQIGFESEVIREVTRTLVPRARVHASGFGSAPNRSLIHGLAQAGRGIELLVGDDDNATMAAKRLLQATVRPILTDIEVSGSSLIGTVPGRLQDVFEGMPLLLCAEVQAGGGELEIRGRLAGSAISWAHRIKLPTDATRTALPIGALFGRARIEDLELQAAAEGGYNKVGLEIERAGLRHGITSSRTSLIAI